jgi:hypothetical protein
MQLTRNQPYLYGYRGFESLPLRHAFTINDLDGWLHWRLQKTGIGAPPSGISPQEIAVKSLVVRLRIRVRLPDGSRPYLDPVTSSNRKLKPLYAVVDGEPEHHPEGSLLPALRP